MKRLDKMDSDLCNDCAKNHVYDCDRNAYVLYSCGVIVECDAFKPNSEVTYELG